MPGPRSLQTAASIGSQRHRSPGRASHADGSVACSSDPAKAEETAATILLREKARRSAHNGFDSGTGSLVDRPAAATSSELTSTRIVPTVSAVSGGKRRASTMRDPDPAEHVDEVMITYLRLAVMDP